MAHYAKIIDNIVVNVIVAEDDFIRKQNPTEGKWVQTSYHIYGGIYYDPGTKLPHFNQAEKIADQDGRQRKNYAGIGYTYDENRDAFIPPTPYPSWKLNEDTCLWEAPIPYPDDDKQYIWNETKQKWTCTE
jgi:hypothetical protein